MLAELRTERDQLAEAILTLERLAVGRGRRRGRSDCLDDGGEAPRQAATQARGAGRSNGGA